MSSDPGHLSVTALEPDHLPGKEDFRGRGRFGLATVLAVLWIVGIVVGRYGSALGVWLALAGAGIAVGLVLVALRRRTVAAVALLGAVLPLGAAWYVVRAERLPADDIGRYLAEQPCLAQVTGRIDGPVALTAPQRGAFARFSYESPQSYFVLRLHTIVVENQPRSVSGRLLVNVRQADARLVPGSLIAATGWLSAFHGPANPGELDRRVIMQRRGLDGRLTLASRGNWQWLAGPDGLSRLPTARRWLSDQADRSLALGLNAGDPAAQRQRGAFLGTILLGRWSRDLAGLDSAFRQVGLAHLLSISGAHLMILLGLVFLVARVLCGSPPRTAVMVLLVLLLYLAAVPLRVPIVRAGVMAGSFMAAWALGMTLCTVDLISLAALVILIADPADLFTPGFQLSFGIVLGLLVLTPRVERMLVGRAVLGDWPPTWRSRLQRAALDYLAVNMVAFGVALPLVAYHFQMISPWCVLLSLVVFPLVTALLGVGYLKIVVGVVLPSAGVLLGRPMVWVSDALTHLVQAAAAAPGATVSLAHAPSPAWTVTTLVLIVAMLAGAFAGRRRALALALAVSLGWLWVGQQVTAAVPWAEPGVAAAARVNMFAVGSGSCYLLRLDGDGDSSGVATEGGDAAEPRTVMFDCGSENDLNVGSTTIVRGLDALGVRRLDVVLLSHADLDHFCGILDVAERVPIGRVLVTPQLWAARERDLRGTVAYLFAGLARHGLAVEVISRGWHAHWHGADLELLWPPADFAGPRDNDMCMLLSVRAAGRRMLLCGDIQQSAIAQILSSGIDVRADVCDLPHHGSFNAESPAFLAAVRPQLVLQSTGPQRLRHDRWPPLLAPRRIQRYVTARDGMVALTIARSGAVYARTYLRRAAVADDAAGP